MVHWAREREETKGRTPTPGRAGPGVPSARARRRRHQGAAHRHQLGTGLCWEGIFSLIVFLIVFFKKELI